MTFPIEHDVLRDLVEFARIEVEANDIEPWSEVIRELALEEEDALWVIKLYNAYDDIRSAWNVRCEWATPYELAAEPLAQRQKIATYPISRERRNFYGGKIIRHFDSYADCLGGKSQRSWISSVSIGDPFQNFVSVVEHLRTVWGVGRQSAFEWAEFLAKVFSANIEPPNAMLWESSGPRESLERLYGLGDDTATPEWLEERAIECKALLASEGVPLSWWDFETVICDFNVMRKGRYYPGKHIAMIRGEIEDLPSPHRERLYAAFESAIPVAWHMVPYSKEIMLQYKASGVIFDWRKS